MKLLILDEVWEDSVHCQGFMLLTEEEFETWTGWAKEYACAEFDFSTTQGLKYNSYDEMMRRIEVKDISDEEAGFLTRTFPVDRNEKTWGIFPMEFERMGWDLKGYHGLSGEPGRWAPPPTSP